jgi:hypothetical protein
MFLARESTGKNPHLPPKPQNLDKLIVSDL